MKKTIIFCLVVIAVVLSVWQWDTTRREYLVSLWPVDDMPLDEIGLIENIEIKVQGNEPATITYNLVSKDILENMIRRYSEFMTGEWHVHGESQLIVIEDGLIQGEIPIKCSIDDSGKYMKTTFELEISETSKFIDRVYKKESLDTVLPIHEQLNGALVEKNMVFHMEEYIELRYVYKLDNDSTISVMDHYKQTIEGAETSESKDGQSITAKADGVDIRISQLDEGVVEIWYGLIK